jgi:hypothetical protein
MSLSLRFLKKCTAAFSLLWFIAQTPSQVLGFADVFAASPSPSPTPSTNPTPGANLGFDAPIVLTPAQLNEMLKEAPIPHQPSAPPQLFERTAPNTFRCQRFYLYQGKTLGCDSGLHADAEKLRPILSMVPEALADLNDYQSTQHRLSNTAYVGSAGLLILLAGFLGGGGNGKKIMYIGGASMFLGSLIYGFTEMRANEGKLGDAVDAYNLARPNDPIVLQFNTGIIF